MPEEANPQFRYWTSWVARSRDPMSLEEHEELFAALGGMYLYLDEQAEEKRQDPTDDLLSYLVHAEDDGERHDPRRAHVAARHALHGRPRADGRPGRQRDAGPAAASPTSSRGCAPSPT